jgi:hypothetical protein
MQTKYTWTDAEAPMNTGSKTRPARLNLRLDCSTRARTHRVLAEIRKLTGMDERKDRKSYADVWEEKALLALEHVVRKVKDGARADRRYFMALFDLLPPEDHAREQYKRLKARFERKGGAA